MNVYVCVEDTFAYQSRMSSIIFADSITRIILISTDVIRDVIELIRY